MLYLHTIVHQDPIIEQKVNFFADYFNFLITKIDQSDFIEFENHLSLIEKIIFQLETNIENSKKYINSYLSHPLLHRDNKYFKEYKNYDCISKLLKEYTSLKDKDRSDWLKKNSDFIFKLKKFKIELKRTMFKYSLKAIISYLLCKQHDIEYHFEDLKFFTNILVSEFLFNNRGKEDIANLFSRIITSDFNKFPYPKKIIDKNKLNILEAKKNYFEKTDFLQQFEGIYNELKKSKTNEYFIFRVFNVNSTPNDFKFNYNNVTFFNPKQKKLIKVRELAKKKDLFSDFFENEKMLIALVKINYYSRNIGEQIAINSINQAIDFLNVTCNGNVYLEKYSYLTTSNFNNLFVFWKRNEKGIEISDLRNSRLNDNFFIFLKKIKSQSKNHFLNNESLYIEALKTRSPKDFWIYLESLIPLKDKIIKIVSSLLLLDALQNEKNILKIYIIDCIINPGNFNTTLGFSFEKYMEYKKRISMENLNFDTSQFESSNLFLKYMVCIESNINKNINYNNLKTYYNRIFWEAYAQRNSIVHSNQSCEKSLIMLNTKLPNLISRLRKIIGNGIKENPNSEFIELIEKLKCKADLLLGNI